MGEGGGRNGTEAKIGGVRKREKANGRSGVPRHSRVTRHEREREEGPGSPKVAPVARRLAQPGSLDDLPIIDLEKDRTRDPSAEDDPPKIRVLPRRLPPSNSIPSLRLSGLSETEECSTAPPKNERQRSHQETDKEGRRRTPSKHTHLPCCRCRPWIPCRTCRCRSTPAWAWTWRWGGWDLARVARRAWWVPPPAGSWSRSPRRSGVDIVRDIMRDMRESEIGYISNGYSGE